MKIPLILLSIFGYCAAICQLNTPLSGRIGSFEDGSGLGENYTNHLLCSWLIQPGGTYNFITLSFSRFDVGTGDYVQLYDGNNTDSLIAAFTGNVVPYATSTSQGQSLLVQFITDAARTGEGWNATYQADYCLRNVVLYDETGIVSDGSGNASYEDNTNCEWVIMNSGPNSIVLNFTSFVTEAGYDFVTIYDGTTPSSGILVSLSGVQGNVVVVGTAGNSMMIRFTSDYSVQGGGWSAVWTRGSGNSTIPTPPGGSNCGLNNPSACVCPGGASECDLLPDIISSGNIIQAEHTEYPGRITFSMATPNIGYGPLEAFGTEECYCGNTSVACTARCDDGDFPKEKVMQRVYRKSGNTITSYDRSAGFMTFHPQHGHIHVENWGFFTLRKATSDPNPLNWPILGTGSKVSFCLINLGNCNTSPQFCVDPETGIERNWGNIPNAGFGVVSGCQRQQGIYVGYLDIYSESLPDMEIYLPSGLCNGEYHIVAESDPTNNFLEVNEANNWVAVPIHLTRQSSCSNDTTASSSIPATSTDGQNFDCTLYSSDNVPLRIPAGNDSQGVMESILQIQDNIIIGKVEVVDLNGVHTYLADLNFDLISPSGVSSRIISRVCGGNRDFYLSMSDSSNQAISCPPTDHGTYQPFQPLSTFIGQSSQGNWTLRITDIADADIGQLNGWNLRLCTPVISTSSPQTTIASTPSPQTSEILLTTGSPQTSQIPSTVVFSTTVPPQTSQLESSATFQPSTTPGTTNPPPLPGFCDYTTCVTVCGAGRVKTCSCTAGNLYIECCCGGESSLAKREANVEEESNETSNAGYLVPVFILICTLLM